MNGLTPCTAAHTHTHTHTNTVGSRQGLGEGLTASFSALPDTVLVMAAERLVEEIHRDVAGWRRGEDVRGRGRSRRGRGRKREGEQRERGRERRERKGGRFGRGVL